MTGTLPTYLRDEQDLWVAPSLNSSKPSMKPSATQDLGDRALGARGRAEDLRVPRTAAVADAREHVGDRI